MMKVYLKNDIVAIFSDNIRLWRGAYENMGNTECATGTVNVTGYYLFEFNYITQHFMIWCSCSEVKICIYILQKYELQAV